MLRQNYKTSCSILALALMGTMSGVWAQDATSQSDDATLTLDPIVVFATKRIEEAFDIAADVNVATAKELAGRNFRTLDELDKEFADMSIERRSGRAYTNVTMRGQSSVDFYNPAVQVYVDGLPQDQATLSQGLPVELEHAEALYGPQGTLYGRGAVGGVINLVTRKPDEESRASLDLTTSNLRQHLSAYANTALIQDALFVDASLSLAQDLGDYRNPTDTDRHGDTQDVTGQVRLRYAPVDGNLDVMASYRHNEVDSDEEVYVSAANVNRRVVLPFPSHYNMRTDSFGLHASYDLDFATITALTGYQDRELERTIFGRYTPETQSSFNQEVRIASNPKDGALLDYVIGAYYQFTDFERKDPSANQISQQDITSYAGFGEATWHATDQLDIIGGLRYDYEESDATASGGINLQKKVSSSAFSPKIGAKYALTDNWNLHALYSSGFKAGGITRNVTAANINFDYDPQTTQSVEIGTKYRSDDGMVELGLTAYASRTKDYQLFVGVVPIQYLQNVGEVESKGVNATLRLRPVEPMTIALNAAYNNTEFTKYNNPVTPGTNLVGNKVPYAPEITANARISYAFDMANNMGTLTPTLAVSYVGETFFDETNALKQDAYTLVDASLAWEYNERLEASLFVNNLLDKTYRTHGFSAPGLGTNYQLGNSREIGGRLSIKF